MRHGSYAIGFGRVKPSYALGFGRVKPSYALGFGRVKHALSLDKFKNDKTGSIPGSQRFQNIGKNTLSSIVGIYKSAVTQHANRLGLDHAWQPKFYDRIIRSEREFQQPAIYIENNPATWEEDEFYGMDDTVD